METRGTLSLGEAGGGLKQSENDESDAICRGGEMKKEGG